MSARESEFALRALPETLPIFPLSGVLLLPRGQLPLNVFEARYRAMTRDAMTGARLIGMVQPIHPEDEGGRAPPVYEAGCAGRITAFEETDDGRYLITLTGLCRFTITGELPLTDTDYRRVHADYDRFAADLAEPRPNRVDRRRLLRALGAYFKLRGYEADRGTVEKASSESLVTTLAMICPFTPSEKQALLEAGDTDERGEILSALMEMAVLDKTRAEIGSIQ